MTYTVIPPAITSFHGTVSVSGGEGCSGEWHFGMNPSAEAEITVNLNTSDLCNIAAEDISWNADGSTMSGELLNDLNSLSNREDLALSLKSLCE